MTQEDKELLLKDLCARLPYGVKYQDRIEGGIYILSLSIIHHYERFIPYLRPMSSMTDEEEKNFNQIFDLELKALEDTTVGHSIESAASSTFMIDFYNKHHFDYRGLIPKGLALEAPNEIYNN